MNRKKLIKTFKRYRLRGLVKIKRAYKYVFFRNKYAKKMRKYAQMDADRALLLTLKAIIFQIKIRPRIRLFTTFLVLMAIVFFASNYFSKYLESKEGEIKINGHQVLVAQQINEKPKADEVEIKQAISLKRSPFEFEKPVEGYISQGYSRYHRAQDIATDLGASILPLGSGLVEFAGYTSDGKGNIVIVDHGDGLKSLYAHMGRINVTVGRTVNPSTAIGTVGLTGRTTGPHVHLEVYDNGIVVNPSSVLPD